MNVRSRDLSKISLSRHERVLQEARAAGMLGVARDARISGRVPARLIDAAKKRAGVTSDTELLELALSLLAMEDDYGEKLLRRKGTIPADVELEF